MITTIKEYKKLNENLIVPSTEPGTMSFWHGGNLDNNITDIAHKSGRYEFGPGLYLTTSYEVVQNYSKGSRKLYLVTVKKGTDLLDVMLDMSKMLDFINLYVIKNKRKDVLDSIERVQTRLNLIDKINAETFLNILINNDAIKNTNTIKLKQFFVKNGIDYYIIDTAFGWHKKMMVVFNMNKIVDITRIQPKDKIETFELPQKFNESINNNFDKLYNIAKGVDYATFVKKTDSVTKYYDILYRGMTDGDGLSNDIFMSDYHGHALTYAETDNNIDGIICSKNDILDFDDNVFNKLRNKLKILNKKDILKIYKPYFERYKLYDAMEGKYETESGVINFVHSFINSNVSYSKVQQKKIENDLLIPIMQYYGKIIGKNIIAFWGGDYLEYGGAVEFVVNDISKYTTLKTIWNDANSKINESINI